MTAAAGSPELVAVRVLGAPVALLERGPPPPGSLEREFQVIGLASPDESEH